ncbi:hypoxanthine-guanine phosphoribosyltransferase [Thioalkalivibrio sp. XN279]|uniref:hypoxanthine-guanine phosphoribosyltransferase n=1 Tax=Thioalkalivibrio sp. XN279 TaxID=2714953 RepID=UPI00140E3D83|nr:hypoxanthine-guanine phosphoribosyltransferase [Thioalkalivibrio sp. XN279]NHA15243.1 hypoxanthine-guanine phosphoribosyltransferase [Thioalkalivibrio sp. XN279]
MRENYDAILARADLLADPARVAQALDEMAVEIRRDLGEHDPVVLAVMVGGLLPTAWLLQRLAFPLQLDYVHATRYQGGTRGIAELEWVARPRTSLRGRSVLVVDDILDEGYTLDAILEDCRDRGATQVRSAVLIDKQHPRRYKNMQADYVGMKLEDRYLFGCGMDFHEHHRQHQGVYALAAEDDHG